MLVREEERRRGYKGYLKALVSKSRWKRGDIQSPPFFPLLRGFVIASDMSCSNGGKITEIAYYSLPSNSRTPGR